MKRPLMESALIIAALAALVSPDRAAAQYGELVVSYDGGTTPAFGFGFASSALGEPSRFTADVGFPSVVSPFSPPFSTSQIVSIGEGGQITLRLSHYAIPESGGAEIGVFANVGIADEDFPTGLAGNPPFTFGLDNAEVWVSEYGLIWTSLGSVTFDIPTNGYTDLTSPFADSPGSSLSDFQQPFTGVLNDFAERTYYDAGGNGILDLLAGSGGGRWLDISGSGLPRVGYIRFSLADDGNPDTSLNFELDAVSIAHDAMGSRVPEPAGILMALAAGIAFLMPRRRGECGAESDRSRARTRGRWLGSSSARRSS